MRNFTNGIGRRNISRGILFLWVVLTIGFCLATYSLTTFLLIRIQSTRISDHGSGRSDPVMEMPETRKLARGSNPKFHVVVTATDAIYSKWQCRIMYYWYKKVKDLPGSGMGGFTRVLHSGRSDNLMEEIPTFVVDPLPNGLDRVHLSSLTKFNAIKGYVVLNRPWAFVQWLEKATIEEKYVLMAEPDHLFVRPLPNLAVGKYPVAFPFFYIKPAENEKIVRKFYPKGSISNVDPIGNSPVIIRKSILKKIAPTWMNVSLRIKNDTEADTTFGWVQEMYAYAIASALHGVKHILHKEFMVQPPWDQKLGDTYIIHYTYGCDYNMKGELTYGKIGEWRFDKRTYLSNPPPKNLTLPPPGIPETVVRLVTMVNEATANIPGWENL
ncbi:hydroxyproline O-arabinosyltransferase NOD3-like isoform X1 [Amaranthus tricolor]|uniref:hydroxyproline O-arabinosyltransferase NOD3-like isoform X1 n=1 Tax=Amaranthus tricolor TaxID=29722 RepID=UPI002582DCAC|nr:hydroxyproline O-arabinosyltransferase NOD3-like isoform X1 [Amaranthus tricolor]XP_057515080.1 hydroxyproline O-arabinosyltransferase NOD3-like isoform X1 [Amaranthus tricolor]